MQFHLYYKDEKTEIQSTSNNQLDTKLVSWIILYLANVRHPTFYYYPSDVLPVFGAFPINSLDYVTILH
jgi:hypothetical protein